MLAALLLTAALAGSAQAPLPALTIRDQTDGVNSLRVVTVAAFCRGPAPCAGTAKLVKGGSRDRQRPVLRRGQDDVQDAAQLKASVFRSLRKAKGRRMKPTLTLTLADGQKFSHVITIKI